MCGEIEQNAEGDLFYYSSFIYVYIKRLDVRDCIIPSIYLLLIVIVIVDHHQDPLWSTRVKVGISSLPHPPA